MPPLLAHAIPPGGTIGIVTPASPYNLYSDVLRGIAWWEARGYHVRLAEGALERTDYVAGSPQHRARDLMAMFADPAIDAIQCMRGGMGSAQVIPYLDFAQIALHPKPFLGFSDITALHCALLKYCGLATFYGPSLTQMATQSAFTAERMLRVLGGDTTGPYPRHPDDDYIHIVARGKATGRLVGGCLSDLMFTMGTPWELDLQDGIFAFEESGSSPQGIDRALLQLSQAGKLDKVRGVVIGDLVGCEWNEGGGSPWPHTKNLEEVLAERLGGLGLPVLSNFPFGHGDHNATLPLGVQAVLDGDAASLEITEPALLI
jgi:muramoyltetrapeptide carboxypeptidase